MLTLISSTLLLSFHAMKSSSAIKFKNNGGRYREVYVMERKEIKSAMLRTRSRSVKYEGRRFEVKATRHLAGADCAMQRDQCTHVQFRGQQTRTRNEAR